MSMIAKDAPGRQVLLMGNEAIARGAIEAGVQVCAAYPGTPSTEITGSLSKVGKDHGIYVEWSVNEKVGLEVAAAERTPASEHVPESGGREHRLVAARRTAHHIPARGGDRHARTPGFPLLGHHGRRQNHNQR